MAQRNAAELAAGAVVLVVALGFLGYAVANTDRIGIGGYTLHASFNAIDGLTVGSDVRMAGVKVGSVTAARLDPQSYQAEVDFSLADDVKLPKDSSAAVTSDGLLGGKYLGLEPGGDTATIPPGGTVTITQSSVNIEQLLGKFIFSMGNLPSPGPSGDKQGDKPAEKPADKPGGGLQ
jgi:phospholipid/cholesterol/gamma-HCH transport system substrate-binding protein